MDWGLGVAFQYLRSLKNTPELVRIGIFLLAAAVLFYASPQGQGVHSVQAFLGGLFGDGGVVQHALVSCTATSLGANGAVALGMPVVHPLVPVTDSN